MSQMVSKIAVFFLMDYFYFSSSQSTSTQPLVSKLNTTALNVSWSSPWSYPVNSYTLTISSPDISPQYNTTNTYFLVSMETLHVSECSPIVLSVEANTDVGGSGNSDNTTTGFPKCKLSHCPIYIEKR